VLRFLDARREPGDEACEAEVVIREAGRFAAQIAQAQLVEDCRSRAVPDRAPTRGTEGRGARAEPATGARGARGGRGRVQTSPSARRSAPPPALCGSGRSAAASLAL